MTDATEDTVLLQRQEVQATVIRACPHCQAPGVFRHEPSIKESWAGCWVPEEDLRVGTPVGPICPHCEGERAGDEPQGVIWARERRGTILERIFRKAT